MAAQITLIQRLKHRLRPSAPPAPPSDPELDLDFYRAFNADLGRLGPVELAAHYAGYGKAEGRPPNEARFFEALQAELGPLPPRFDARLYRAMHPDLEAALPNHWEAARHYLISGQAEKRDFTHFDPEMYRALYFSDAVITDYELGLHYRSEGRKAGLIGSLTQYVADKGVPYGAWVHALRPNEFGLLNWSWCGPIRSRLDAIEALLDQGIGRLAHISFEHRFDPIYYREANPQYRELDDEAVYRQWLFVDLDRNWPASPEQCLRSLGLSISQYPESFDWNGYLRRRFDGTGSRWFALGDLLNQGFRDAPDIFISGDQAADFYMALGDFFRGRDDLLAIRAFQRAGALGVDNYALHHHLADACFRRGRWRAALEGFQRAAAFSGAELWTFVNGAAAARRIGAFRAAADLLEAGKPTIGGEPRFRDAVRDLTEDYFTVRTRRARTLYHRPEGRARADRQVLAVIEGVKSLWMRLDPIGAPTPASVQGRVVMLASFDLAVCTHYRIDQKRELFQLIGRPLEIYGLNDTDAFLSALPGAEAVIFFRIPAWPSVVRAMLAAKNMNIPSYYEIDDLIFDAEQYPDTFESYGGLLTREAYEAQLFGTPLFRAAIELCDYGISSTMPLSRAVEPLVRTGRVFWLPNGLDSRNEAFLKETPTRVRRDGSVMIAYASGTTAHNSDFNELAGPALVNVLTARPNVRLLVVGYLALDKTFDAVRDQIVRYDYVHGAAAFWSMLADADLNIAVLKSTWATDSKSEIKWLEAAVMGIPSVVSETAMYREVLDDGVDALIVRTSEEWEAALIRMVDDAALRTSIGRAAQAKAGRRYSLAANARRLAALLGPAREARRRDTAVRSKPRAERKTRVLLSNVWFPPQTIGGATRVMRNNLDAWLDSEVADSFEFAVVCTDNDVRPPYRRRVDDYRGVTVYRISTPLEHNMDWRPEDGAVKRIFTEVLESWRPDLIHFHAIQRLTASVVQAAQAARIPYLVTPHDAWWLSDWHFLVDDQGRVREPCEDQPRNPPSGVTVSQALDRRRVLNAALHGAQKILGVSDVFAEIHRKCGFSQSISVPNGLPPLVSVARTRSASGRVRLAHVGNVSPHKGYDLIKAALMQSRFANLELTVIDHGRSGGYIDRALWGATPVRTIGKLPQDHIQELYSETDVLLAPSIWPESYGLVTREALSSGLWVLASDRGAIGQDVVPGVNGFVIDVSTPGELISTLCEINDDCERYLQSPPAAPHLRSADDQAKEVAAIYREVVYLRSPVLAMVQA